MKQNHKIPRLYRLLHANPLRARPPGSPLHEKLKQFLDSIDSAIDHVSYMTRLFSTGMRYPFLTVIIPVYKPDLSLLKKAVSSVTSQTYQRWELILIDDGSNDKDLSNLLHRFSKNEVHKIRVLHHTKNEGIASAVNRAALISSGDYLGVLDQDDELSFSTLYHFSRYIVRYCNPDVIYCDEDKIDENGLHGFPWFKSDWNHDLLLSFNYIMHFVLYRRVFFFSLGGLRSRFDGSQDYDLILRASEKTRRIVHIPKILYHWRISQGSIAGGPAAKPWVFTSGLAALNDAVARRGIQGHAEDAPYAWKGVYRVRRALRTGYRCSLLILCREGLSEGFERLVASMGSAIDRNYEVLVSSSLPVSPESLIRLFPLPHRASTRHFCLPSASAPEAFNAMAGEARGDLLIFLDDTLELLERDSFNALLEQGQREEVGAAGGKIFYADGLVEHAGVILGPFGLLGYAHRATPDDPGYVGLKNMIGNFSAVMGLGMVTQRSRFDRMNGFDMAFSKAYWDIDYCLRLGEQGFLVTYTPYARFRHRILPPPCKAMVIEPEASAFRRRWGHRIDNDPYFNDNFSRDREDFFPRS